MERRGFTLVELTLVVAVIAILIAIAIPSMLRSRITANEASAVSSLRTIVSAETMYKANEDLHVYAVLSDLSSSTPTYIDSILGNTAYNLDATGGGIYSLKSGYGFEVTVDPVTADANYVGNAIPQSYNKTGSRSFYVNADGVIRFDDTGSQGASANSYDPPLDG